MGKHVAVDELGAGLAKPNTVLDGAPLRFCEKGVIPRPPWRCRSDVRRDPEVDAALRVACRPRGRLPAVSIRAPEAHAMSKALLGSRRKVVAQSQLPRSRRERNANLT